MDDRELIVRVLYGVLADRPMKDKLKFCLDYGVPDDIVKEVVLMCAPIMYDYNLYHSQCDLYSTQRIYDGICDAERNNMIWQQHRCVKCGSIFVTSHSFIMYYKSRNFDEPKKCPNCRAQYKNNGGIQSGKQFQI
jgi:hypothetical protein